MMKLNSNRHLFERVRPLFRSGVLVAVLLTTVSSPSAVTAQTAGPTRTTLDGVFSAEQVARGQQAYDNWCSRCHGGEGGGGVRAPDLDIPAFIDRWREYDLDFLYTMIRRDMPPRTEVRATDPEYLDILTYILHRNDYPAGPDELTADAVTDVLLVGPDGPQPIPGGALASITGCLDEVDQGRWSVVRATEPRRSKTDFSSPEELSAAATVPLGPNAYRVVNFDYVSPDLTPDAYAGHRILIKGFLIRQPNAERVNLTDLDSVGETCAEPE